MLIPRCCDSFDCYTDLTQNYDTVFSAGATAPSISSSAARTGLNGLRFPASTSAGDARSFVQQAFGTNLATFHVGFAIRPNAWAIGTSGNIYAVTQILSFWESGGQHLGINILNGGQIAAYGGGPTLLGTANVNSLALNAWRYIEVKVVVHNSAGTITVKVDGTTWLALTGVNTRNGSSNAYATSLALGNSSQFTNVSGVTLGAFDIDDLVTLDTTGSYNNTYIGDVAIKCKFPNANGTTQQWTRNTGANNYAAVNENPPDGDTTYVSDATVGEIDRNLYPTTTGTVVKAVIARPLARKDDGTSRSIRAVTKSGATLGDNGSDFALSTSYVYYHGLFETDPNTSLPWAIAAVNSAEFGVKVTV